MLYRYTKSEPRWISFENRTGAKGGGGFENNGAKGHAWEHFFAGEEKVLCDLTASGVLRRIWFTLSDRSEMTLQNVILRCYWDGSDEPQVDVPIGDFFCMGLGVMRGFENEFFATAEGRSFVCTIPMPFRSRCRVVLVNNTGRKINNLFYDLDLTLEELSDDDMRFHARFSDGVNQLCEDVKILPRVSGSGRFLGTSIAVIPDTERYGELWWGEGEVKIYLDGDRELPTLVGTGAEDYIGSAWELGEFVNRCSGCVTRRGNAVSMYRFHVRDSICFASDIEVTLQAMGGERCEPVRAAIAKGSPLVPVSYDNGDLHGIYGTDFDGELEGYVNFYRVDRYRTVAYYYLR